MGIDGNHTRHLGTLRTQPAPYVVSGGSQVIYAACGSQINFSFKYQGLLTPEYRLSRSLRAYVDRFVRL